MRVASCLAFLLFSQNPISEIQDPDLEAMLQRDEALQKLLIVYWPPAQKDWQQAFFVRGDGTVIKQAVPARMTFVSDIPTCTEPISVERAKALVRLIIRERFFELPERQFIIMNSPQRNEDLETHSIGISDGQAKARRFFGVGKFAWKPRGHSATICGHRKMN